MTDGVSKFIHALYGLKSFKFMPSIHLIVWFHVKLLMWHVGPILWMLWNHIYTSSGRSKILTSRIPIYRFKFLRQKHSVNAQDLFSFLMGHFIEHFVWLLSSIEPQCAPVECCREAMQVLSSAFAEFCWEPLLDDVNTSYRGMLTHFDECCWDMSNNHFIQHLVGTKMSHTIHSKGSPKDLHQHFF